MGDINIQGTKEELEKNRELLERLNDMQSELANVREYIEKNFKGDN